MAGRRPQALFQVLDTVCSEKQVLLRVDKLDQVSYYVQVVCHGGILHCRLKARQALKLCLL